MNSNEVINTQISQLVVKYGMQYSSSPPEKKADINTALTILVHARMSPDDSKARQLMGIARAVIKGGKGNEV